MNDDSPATDWAWSQIASPNLDFGDLAITFLAFARYADQDLNSPNGYAFTTATEVSALLGRLDLMDVAIDAARLADAGSLVKVEGGWRIPEEAFNRHLVDNPGCRRCDFGTPAFQVVTKGEGTREREDVCPACASRLVAANEVASITPLEAVHA